MEDTVDKADNDRANAKEAVATAQASYDNANLHAQVSPTAARSRRNKNRVDYASMAGQTSAQPVNDELLDALTQAIVDLDKVEAHYQRLTYEWAAWRLDNYHSAEKFKEVDMESVRPILDEYKRLFGDPSGD